MDFNLQDFLVEMRKEQRSDLEGLRKEQRIDLEALRREQRRGRRALHKRIDTVMTHVEKHNNRLQEVEATTKIAKWATRTAIVALLGGCIDFLINHIPKVFTTIAKP